MREYNRLTNRGTPYYAFDKCKTCEYGKDGCDKWCDQTVGCFCRLQELEDKIENGTLIELPCKVGDTVYEVFKSHKPPFIQKTTIEKIIITEKGLKLKLARNSLYETAISSLGKTLFLTQSEAETKLKELQEK